MRNRHDSKSYTINILYGNSDLNHIIDDLAKQTIFKNSGVFGDSNMRVKKSKDIRLAM